MPVSAPAAAHNTSESEPDQAPTPDRFALPDFIRPGEERAYVSLREALIHDLAPDGVLEHVLVDEIRRAVWRLRRCGTVEGHLVLLLSENPSCALDPMETDRLDAVEIQKSVDRARSQATRLLTKCTAELRRLQTERQFAKQHALPDLEIPSLGIADWRSVASAHRAAARDVSRNSSPGSKMTERTQSGADAESQMTEQTQSNREIARNAPCPCRSGLKYKRCCGKNAPAVLRAA